MASEEEKADKAAAERCPKGIRGAAECGDLPALRHFLRVDPESVHEKAESGWTPLHAAAFNGHVEAAELLLSKGAAVDAKRNDTGDTPLHLAAYKGHVEAAELLLSKGAAVDATKNDGWTPLHLAAYNGHVEAAEFLLSKGAAVDAKENDGDTPLHLAACNGHVKAAELLLSKGAAVDATKNNGDTPLHLAASKGQVEAAELLLSKGAAVDAKSDRGWTPLHLAAYNGHVEAAEFLLSKGAAVDAKENDGWTPLHQAVFKGHVEAAEFLLSKGAAVDAKRKDGKTPLDLAREKDETEMEQLLLNASAKKASAEDGKTPSDLSSKGKAEMKPLPTAADKTSEAGKKAQQTPVFEFSSPRRQTSKEEAAPHAAGSGAAAVKHQREASKEEAKKPSAGDGKAPVHGADKASEEVKKAGKTTAAPAEGNQDDPEVERGRAPCATHGGGTTIVRDTSAVEIPMGEGTPVAMFSLRFDGGPTEKKMRRVHKILVDNSYNALMVQVNGGESFGVLTARYLNKLKVGKGLMIAVCTHHYGEMTSSKFCSYYELKFAVTNGIAVLPLRVEETYPLQPPCGKDHLDKECDAQGFIGMTFGDDVLYVDCRTMSEMDIAHAIATRLHQLRDERQGS